MYIKNAERMVAINGGQNTGIPGNQSKHYTHTHIYIIKFINTHYFRNFIALQILTLKQY